MRKTLITLLVLAGVAIAQQASKYNQSGVVIHRHGTSGGDAPYSATLGDKSYGCYTTDNSVDCQQKQQWETYSIVINGQEFRLSPWNPDRRHVFGKEDEMKCWPIEDKIKDAEKKHWEERTGRVEIEFRFGKTQGQIFVPCTYLDDHNREKKGEARYFIF